MNPISRISTRVSARALAAVIGLVGAVALSGGLVVITAGEAGAEQATGSPSESPCHSPSESPSATVTSPSVSPTVKGIETTRPSPTVKGTETTRVLPTAVNAGVQGAPTGSAGSPWGLAMVGAGLAMILAALDQVSSGGNSFQVIVNNPLPEKTSDTVVRQMMRIEQLGLLDSGRSRDR